MLIFALGDALRLPGQMTQVGLEGLERADNVAFALADIFEISLAQRVCQMADIPEQRVQLFNALEAAQTFGHIPFTG